jgi:hypothetical protein
MSNLSLVARRAKWDIQHPMSNIQVQRSDVRCQRSEVICVTPEWSGRFRYGSASKILMRWRMAPVSATALQRCIESRQVPRVAALRDCLREHRCAPKRNAGCEPAQSMAKPCGTCQGGALATFPSPVVRNENVWREFQTPLIPSPEGGKTGPARLGCRCPVKGLTGTTTRDFVSRFTSHVSPL